MDAKDIKAGKINCDKENTVVISIELEGIEEAQQKAERLVETLEKAKSLADEMACEKTNSQNYLNF